MTHELPTNAERVGELAAPPEAWIGTASDYDGDRQFGDWVDVGRPMGDVITSIGRLIDRTPHAIGQRWSVHQVRNFGVWQPGADDGLRDVVMVGQGVRLYGPPYSGLVSVVGPDSIAARFERFRQSFLGSWPGLAEFAEQVISESGWHDALNGLPRPMRPFVNIDMKRLIREIKRDLTVVDHDAGVWVYDPRLC